MGEFLGWMRGNSLKGEAERNKGKKKRSQEGESGDNVILG
jgi:hypothetical protein